MGQGSGLSSPLGRAYQLLFSIYLVSLSATNNQSNAPKKERKKEKKRQELGTILPKAKKIPRFWVIEKIVELGEFETVQVEETQLPKGWYSIIQKLGSIPGSTVNGLSRHQG